MSPSIDQDMASVDRYLTGEVATYPGDPNMGFVSEAIAVFQIAQNLKGLFADKKKGFKEYEKASKQVVAAYGTNIQAASAAMGLDPNMVASAASDYLKIRGVTLSPAQLLAMGGGGQGGGVSMSNLSSMLPLILMGGAGLFFIMSRR